MAIITVTTASDETADDGETTLREAIALANAAEGADQIIFDDAVFATDTTIRLTQGELVITDAVTIDGAGLITVTGDANGDDGLVAGTDITDLATTDESQLDDNSRVFKVDPGENAVTFQGLTVTGGHSSEFRGQGGGISSYSVYGSRNNYTPQPNGASIIILDSVISGNLTSSRTAPGGGVSGGDVTITGSTISGNSTIGSYGNGGGVFGNDVKITNSTISGNQTFDGTSAGGGVSGRNVDIDNTTIANNISASSGGGINGIYIDVENVTVTGNFSRYSGGSISSAISNVVDSIILGNQTTQPLSNDFFSGGEVSIDNSIIGFDFFTSSNAGYFFNNENTPRADAISINPETVFAETELRNDVLSGVLADNGGDTATIALRAANENPALDAAASDTVVDTDQRRLPGQVDLASVSNGSSRDLGAFELQADEFDADFSPVPIPPVSNTSTPGVDFFFGGAAANTIFGRRGDDVLSGESGVDTIRGGGGEDTLIGGNGADTLAGGGDDDFLTGGAGADYMKGGRGSDLLHGEGGADRILGLAGDDTLRGGEGRDVLLGGLGDDLIQGAPGNDRLFGGDGNDTIVGAADSDASGTDTVVGGGGDDRLSGFGGGQTEFVFRDGDGSDEIIFFEQGIDKIRVLRGADEFDDLTILQDQEDVIIRFSDVQITVDDQQLSDFGEDDFLF